MVLLAEEKRLLSMQHMPSLSQAGHLPHICHKHLSGSLVQACCSAAAFQNKRCNHHISYNAAISG